MVLVPVMLQASMPIVLLVMVIAVMGVAVAMWRFVTPTLDAPVPERLQIVEGTAAQIGDRNIMHVHNHYYADAARQKSSKIASRHKLAAILDIVGNVRYRRRERSVASRLPKRDRKLSDYNRKDYRAFPTAVADIPDYIQDGGQLVPVTRRYEA
ncbi:hypothetical protein Bbelb_257560 [Branchiostoma belcheri]|nr:hypothetical protein Bbelb_257560 [Branchiostoma belcheri]